MTEPTTFEVFQYAMILQKGKPVYEDFVVILQKLSSNDAPTLKNIMSTKLIEMMNEEMLKKERD
jgi:hypothetical protein